MKPMTFIFLTVSGLLLLAIGGTILFVPHAFYASDGIVLGNDPSLLSEIRAPGGLLATSGLFILAGVLRPTLRSLALMLTVLVYGSFGLSRLLSFYLDGMPSNSLVIATVIELIMAGIGLVMLRSIMGGSPSDCSMHGGQFNGGRCRFGLGHGGFLREELRSVSRWVMSCSSRSRSWAVTGRTKSSRTWSSRPSSRSRRAQGSGTGADAGVGA